MNILVSQSESLILQRESSVLLQSLTARVDEAHKDQKQAEKLFGVAEMPERVRRASLHKAELVRRCLVRRCVRKG